MINKSNITTLFKALDEALGQKNEKREITVFGSGPLIANDIIDRATVDIDMVDPAMDMGLQLIAADVGEMFNLDMTWLNSAGHIFSRNFPQGWKDRVKVHYKGTNLVVKFLDRRDLIATKFYAACQRGEQDINDLVAIEPSKKELNEAKKWILKSEQDPDWFKHVEYILAEVTKRLKTGD
ncbi:MAG: hypothetical protein H6626_15250 [Pseudobdellovibrionaceae bacterium]|nr:MAG: hypothetical protein H6626_15250 [Pseudobdellovibrionaceae bacterium]